MRVMNEWGGARRRGRLRTEVWRDVTDAGGVASRPGEMVIHVDAPDLTGMGAALPATAKRQPAGRVPAVALRPIRVLVLEDDPETSELLTLVLSPEEGFEVVGARDVRGCMERLRARGPAEDARPFDVLLLDVILRGGHLGTEVLAAAQADPGLHLPPVVVCTALSGAYLAGRAPELAASTVRLVQKPFDIDELAAELRAAASS